jgi:hypothetical protein
LFFCFGLRPFATAATTTTRSVPRVLLANDVL